MFFLGFSKQIIAILNEQNVEFSTFDILEDEEVRQGKTVSMFCKFNMIWSFFFQFSTFLPRLEEIFRLADIPATVRQWRIVGRIGYREGACRKRRASVSAAAKGSCIQVENLYQSKYLPVLLGIPGK